MSCVTVNSSSWMPKHFHVSFHSPNFNSTPNRELSITMIAKVVLVCALVAAVLAAAPVVDICSKPGALISNVKYTINPDKITPGSNLTVTVTGTLSKNVAAAQVVASVKFDGIPFLSKTIDVCKMDPKICPFAAGPFSYDITHKVPNIPISGKADLKAVMTSLPDGAQMVCVDIQANLP